MRKHQIRLLATAATPADQHVAEPLPLINNGLPISGIIEPQLRQRVLSLAVVACPARRHQVVRIGTTTPAMGNDVIKRRRERQLDSVSRLVGSGSCIEDAPAEECFHALEDRPWDYADLAVPAPVTVADEKGPLEGSNAPRGIEFNQRLVGWILPKVFMSKPPSVLGMNVEPGVQLIRASGFQGGARRSRGLRYCETVGIRESIKGLVEPVLGPQRACRTPVGGVAAEFRAGLGGSTAHAVTLDQAAKAPRCC